MLTNEAIAHFKLNDVEEEDRTALPYEEQQNWKENLNEKFSRNKYEKGSNTN